MSQQSAVRSALSGGWRIIGTTLDHRNNTVAVVLWRRSFSNIKAPYKKPALPIPAQGVGFTLLLFPTMIYFLYAMQFGPTQESTEAEIRRRYAERQPKNIRRTEGMQEFFDRTIYKQDGSADKDFAYLLHAGKGGKKRMHAIDSDLYGTAEGLAEKKRYEEEQQKALEEKKRRKAAGETVIVSSKKKNKAAAAAAAAAAATATPPSPPATNSTNEGAVAGVAPQQQSTSGSMDPKSVATVVAVATVAAAAGYLAGGKQR